MTRRSTVKKEILDIAALKDFLDRKVEEYNRPSFIASDPVSVPHLFNKKQDIEIAGFFAAIFAWGNRTTIIRKCRELMSLMDNSPHEFIIAHREKDGRRFEGFCHRTFNTTDLLYFISFLRHHYKKYDSLESAFFPWKDSSELKEKSSGILPVTSSTGDDFDASDGSSCRKDEIIEQCLNYFSGYFFSLEDVPLRTRKHIASPVKHSACKRLNMYLRWMVRNDGKGVDFGLWKKMSPSQLICPIDLHVARVAKKFHLLARPLPDWQAAIELTRNLRAFDPLDPVKYDYALFALGVNERF